MLGFIISTMAFSWAMFALPRHSGVQSFGTEQSRKLLVLTLATVFSIGIGWVVDELDGDADRPHPSLTEVISSGDPVMLAKLFIGIN